MKKTKGQQQQQTIITSQKIIHLMLYKFMNVLLLK